MRRISLIATVLLVVSTVAACNSDSSPTAPNATQLAVELTDQPTDEVSEINVYISGLTVKHSEQPVEEIVADVGLVDLLTLTDGATELLATVPADPGEYEFIMVELDQSQSFVVDAETGTEMALQIPSEEIKVLGGFEVLEDMTTTLTLDFDAEQSLIKLGNGNWLMTPVIVLAGVDHS